MRTLLVAPSLAVLAVALAAAPLHARDRGAEAERLRREGRDRYSEGTFEQRRTAIRQLEQAARLAPGDLGVLDELGRAYLDAGFTHGAQETFERMTKLAPGRAQAWFGLGQVWKRDWLATLAPASLDRAIENYGNAARLDPKRAEAWTTLAVLRAERGDVAGAAVCARQAMAADSAHGGAPLADAYVAYRAGHVAEADRLFTAAFARLAPRLAARFRDVTPLVPAADGDALSQMTPAARAEYTRRFWIENDPDPTTPVNEARVEYWARVAHAALLFSDSWDPHWDMRAELYVRYGPPASMDYQPPGRPLAQRPNRNDYWYQDYPGGGEAREPRRVGEADPMWYPEHVQVWAYPNLGMSVVLEDMAISQHYELPRDPYGETEPVPDTAAMARNGLVGTSGGRAAFASLPPGVQPLELEGEVNAFEGERGPRLLAHLALAAPPGGDLVAECVVFDSTEREVARASRPMGASRCDPAVSRAGDFAFDLPPGRYRVGMAVSDGQGGRGVLRARRDLAPPAASLAMSDLVLVCGPLEAAPTAGSVRLDANLGSRIGDGEALFAYFEVYHLQPDPQGTARFEYDYIVRPAGEAQRGWLRRLFARATPHEISVHSPEEGVGPTRRQFITVPAQSLPPGRYRLEITVHDRLAGRSFHREAEFVKEGAAEPAPAGS